MRFYNLEERESPILLSIPHAGTHIPDDIEEMMSTAGKSLIDTDWHVPKLYPFAEELNITTLEATHSRYVIDLNRSPEDEHLYPGQMKTGLCPTHTFYGAPIYEHAFQMNDHMVQERIKDYWKPYHTQLRLQLDRIRATYGYAILFDAHSIRSQVPKLFEGTLPTLNLGTNNNTSCAAHLAESALELLQQSDYETVLNQRFLGGYITRNYGDPDEAYHAIQMELTWDSYMDEDTQQFDEKKAEKLSATLRGLFEMLLEWHPHDQAKPEKTRLWQKLWAAK